MDNSILQKYKNAPARADAILNNISKIQQRIGQELGYAQKEFKFELTYNILKVIKMSQKIVSLEKRIESLEKRAKMAQKNAEEAQKNAEVERKQKEKYMRKLQSLGVDPDAL